MEEKKRKLLLHICCGPCGVHVIERLLKYFDVTLFYTNSCISPKEEYEKRLEETKKVAKLHKVNLYVDDYRHDAWLETIKGREKDEEGEERCKICIKDRLERTMVKAKELKMDVFGTTLTVSPHKDALMINQYGKYLAVKNKIDFLVSDFKKNDGYKKSVEKSKEHNLYRQDYCGCEFSMNQSN